MNMARNSEYDSLHFVLIPHLAHGHLIPMMDMARLLARRGPTVTVITTPLHAARYRSTLDRSARSGLRIRLLEVPFPSSEAGLPQGCESVDSLPSRSLFKNLLLGIRMLQEPVQKLLTRLEPSPSCLISDKSIMWADEIAGKFEIPRVVFDGTSCFSLLCTHLIVESRVYETVPVAEPFVVPGLPDQIELTRAQLPRAVNIDQSDTKDVRDEIRSKELAAYGVVANTFEELEPAYVEGFRKVRGRVWCIGPVSLVNEHSLDKAERGNRAAMDESHCLKWLDRQTLKSVVYTCLGSLSRLIVPQLIELGLGLEASNRPFILVVGDGQRSKEFDDWVLESGFEERIGERGLLIRGWAPQVLILSHTAVGGFLTHCGWNSTLEGICAGVPMATWPMFAEQFYNEKIIVQVLRIGVSLGSKFAIRWGEENKSGAVMNRETVERAVAELMGEEEEAQGRIELGKLEHLQYLELYKNNIEGTIPAELGNLKSLISLDLYNNNISGTIPASLGKLKSLVFLRLNDNKLTGPIPRELVGISSLKVLDVSNNNLCGTIPTTGPFEHIPLNNFENNPRLEGPELLGLASYDTNCS